MSDELILHIESCTDCQDMEDNKPEGWEEAIEECQLNCEISAAEALGDSIKEQRLEDSWEK